MVYCGLKLQGVSLTDTNIYGQTALHCAAMGGHAEALARVIQYGFEIDKRSLEGQTPLLVAAAYGRPAAIATLAQYGADLSARDRNGANAVMLACVGCRSCGLPHPNGLNDHALIVCMSSCFLYLFFLFLILSHLLMLGTQLFMKIHCPTLCFHF